MPKKNDITKFVLRLPEKLYQQLKVQAARQNLSINQLCNLLLKNPNTEINRDIPSNNLYFEQNILLSDVVKILGDNAKKVNSIILFGSYARNEQSSSSDIDILLVLKKDLVVSRNLYQAWDNQKISLSSKISPQFVEFPISLEKVSSLWYEIALDGIILFDLDLKASRFLIELRKYILTNNIERKTSYGQTYWIKKEAA